VVKPLEKSFVVLGLDSRPLWHMNMTIVRVLGFLLATSSQITDAQVAPVYSHLSSDGSAITSVHRKRVHLKNSSDCKWKATWCDVKCLTSTIAFLWMLQDRVWSSVYLTVNWSTVPESWWRACLAVTDFILSPSIRYCLTFSCANNNWRLSNAYSRA
jgi:hypothetical protein